MAHRVVDHVLFSVFCVLGSEYVLDALEAHLLGDAGSLYLGFAIAWMLIYFSQQPVSKIEPVAALWCVAIPVWDTLVVMARRIKNGRSPFAPDRNHFHHLFVDMKMDSRLALAVILGISILFGAFGIWLNYAISPVFSLITYALMFLIFGYGMLHPHQSKESLHTSSDWSTSTETLDQFAYLSRNNRSNLFASFL